MEPCTTLSCVSDRLRNTSTSNATEDTPPDNKSLLTTSSFRILLPIIVVLGIMITTAIVFIAHKIVTKYLYKHWRPDSETGSSVTTRSGTSGSRSEVNTISGNYGDLPSYGQVMEAIEREEMPPPYYKVASGVVNIGFSGEEEGNVDNRTTEYSAREVPSTDQLGLTNEQSESSHVTRNGEIVTNCTGTANSEVPQTRPSPDIVHVLPQETATVPREVIAVGPSVHRNGVSPRIEEPMAIVIHDIDEIINSISVPSILSSENEAPDRITSPKVKLAKQRKRPGTYFGRTISFSSSNNTAVPKTPPVIISNSADGDTVLSIEYTPV